MEFINKNPKIYILSGKAGSGKTTVANLMQEINENNKKKTICLAYADYLKMYAKAVLGWDGLDENKPREFLQQLGIELIKNNLDDKFLINRIIDDIKIYSYFYDVIIITDARLIDEIEDIKKIYKDAKSIRISGNSNCLTNTQKQHKTEIGLDEYNDYDYEIVNDETIEALKNKIEKIIGE